MLSIVVPTAPGRRRDRQVEPDHAGFQVLGPWPLGHGAAAPGRFAYRSTLVALSGNVMFTIAPRPPNSYGRFTAAA